MNIASTQFNLENSALEIYLSGCDGACSESCHNKELWDFNIGSNYADELLNIAVKIQGFEDLIDNIWILGGEPLLQNHSKLLKMIEALSVIGKDIWLWTRFEYEEVPKEYLPYLKYIKCGKYDETKLVDDNIQYGIKLASSNQYIYEVKSEVWKDIEGYEGYYQISSYGNVKSLDRVIHYREGKMRNYPANDLKLEPTKDGYRRVVLMKEHKKKRFMVHRLVAKAFIENKENTQVVNHKNGVKHHNWVNNLEWCTAKENCQHAHKNKLVDMSSHQPSNSKKVLCVEENLEFKSINKALKWLGKSKNCVSTISRAIKNNRKAYGYTWQYVEELNEDSKR